MILVATVQHSGTMQLLKILGRETCPLEEREKATDRNVLFAHLYDHLMPLILGFEGAVLTTKRPEADIRASWMRRGKDLAELEQQLANYRTLLERKPYVLELGCR